MNSQPLPWELLFNAWQIFLKNIFRISLFVILTLVLFGAPIIALIGLSIVLAVVFSAEPAVFISVGALAAIGAVIAFGAGTASLNRFVLALCRDESIKMSAVYKEGLSSCISVLLAQSFATVISIPVVMLTTLVFLPLEFVPGGSIISSILLLAVSGIISGWALLIVFATVDLNKGSISGITSGTSLLFKNSKYILTTMFFWVLIGSILTLLAQFGFAIDSKSIMILAGILLPAWWVLGFLYTGAMYVTVGGHSKEAVSKHDGGNTRGIIMVIMVALAVLFVGAMVLLVFSDGIVKFGDVMGAFLDK